MNSPLLIVNLVKNEDVHLELVSYGRIKICITRCIIGSKKCTKKSKKRGYVLLKKFIVNNGGDHFRNLKHNCVLD